MSREFWDREGHKPNCPTWGDEEMIERCTCDDWQRVNQDAIDHTYCPICSAGPGERCHALSTGRVMRTSHYRRKEKERVRQANKHVTTGRFVVNHPQLELLPKTYTGTNYVVQAANAVDAIVDVHERLAAGIYDRVVIDSLSDLQERSLKSLAKQYLEKEEGSTMNKRRELLALESRRDALLATEARIAELRAELDARPEELPVDSVVSFERAYERNGKKYSFVAYHAVQGKWYLSQDGVYGAKLPSYDWDSLLDFIGDNTVFVATAWEELK